MVTVKGHGAKELLRVGGKLPGPAASLRFNVPQSTLMDCRDGEILVWTWGFLFCGKHQNELCYCILPSGLRSSSKPLFAIRKSFKVENAGELPLTVISMNINGYKCQGFGFEVLQCPSFSLEQNTSSEITIAYVKHHAIHSVSAPDFLEADGSCLVDFQVYSRLHLLLGHSGPYPCDLPRHHLSFHPQCDAPPPHAAALCPGGAWPQLGGNLLGGHPHIHVVRSSQCYLN